MFAKRKTEEQADSTAQALNWIRETVVATANHPL
jgi:hypothetical protein